MENPNYKNENIKKKYLKKMRKNTLLQSEKGSIELKGKELKKR